MEKRAKPVIVDKNAQGLTEVVDACPVGCFARKGDLVFVARPHSCMSCGVCEGLTKGIVVEHKQ